MPVPGSLRAINLWVLAGTNGATLVDTGMRDAVTKNAWEVLKANHFNNFSVERVFVTHMHPDHSGLAGWLIEQFPNSILSMSRLEYYVLRELSRDVGRTLPASVLKFYCQCGWSQKQLASYQSEFGSFAKMIHPLPNLFDAVVDGDQINTGVTQWEVVTGRGHSPEQSLLYSVENELLIAGDQVLPTISPNVSVFPQEPNADPLSDWLQSLERLKQRVPNSVLVLPSHGRPFRGLHSRIEAIVDEHEKSLSELAKFLSRPKRVVDTFEVLFRREIPSSQLVMATGEALAHLACLRARGLAQSHAGVDGVDLWMASL